MLVRKARSIKDPDSLGGWLRGVASRTALRARCREARRHAVERKRSETLRAEEAGDQCSPEVRNLIRAELDRLPASYREPVTLCYLRGMTHQEAASHLGWPVGTVKVRLVRGRRLLRERLDRRGLGLGASLLLFLLNPSKAKAAPLALVDSTVRAMTLAGEGRRAALNREFPVAHRLADSGLRASDSVRFAWVFAAAVVVLAAVGLCGPAVRGFQAPTSNGIDRASLPANLTDVLNVDCE